VTTALTEVIPSIIDGETPIYAEVVADLGDPTTATAPTGHRSCQLDQTWQPGDTEIIRPINTASLTLPGVSGE